MTTLNDVKGLFKFYANNLKIVLSACGRLYKEYVELFPNERSKYSFNSKTIYIED